LASLVRRERKGKRRGAAGFAAAEAGRRGRGEEERKGGREEADRWGRGVSESQGKRIRERERGPARGGVSGLLGRLGRKVRRVRFSFFLFLFSNSFLKQLFFPNSNQIL
jgi:hypothetical protein